MAAVFFHGSVVFRTEAFLDKYGNQAYERSMTGVQVACLGLVLTALFESSSMLSTVKNVLDWSLENDPRSPEQFCQMLEAALDQAYEQFGKAKPVKGGPSPCSR